MRLAFVVAVGCVDFEDVAVTGFEHTQDCGLVDCARADVVCECPEQVHVGAILLI